jgi:hypothetical protein
MSTPTTAARLLWEAHVGNYYSQIRSPNDNIRNIKTNIIEFAELYDIELDKVVRIEISVKCNGMDRPAFETFSKEFQSDFHREFREALQFAGWSDAQDVDIKNTSYVNSCSPELSTMTVVVLVQNAINRDRITRLSDWAESTGGSQEWLNKFLNTYQIFTAERRRGGVFYITRSGV